MCFMSWIFKDAFAPFERYVCAKSFHINQYIKAKHERVFEMYIPYAQGLVQNTWDDWANPFKQIKLNNATTSSH